MTKIKRAYNVLAHAYDRLRPLWISGVLGHAEQFPEGKIFLNTAPRAQPSFDFAPSTRALEHITKAELA